MLCPEWVMEWVQCPGQKAGIRRRCLISVSTFAASNVFNDNIEELHMYVGDFARLICCLWFFH